MKICGKCGAQHELKRPGTQCDSCRKEYDKEYNKDYRKSHPTRRHNSPDYDYIRRLKKYGLTIESYEALLAAQGGGCATCHTTVPWSRGNRFHVDHNHETGKVRGLLCSNCNMALGHAKDDPILLRSLADYLER